MKAQHLSVDKLTHKTPTEQRQEARTQRRALIRGRRLIALGAVVLALFGAVTAAVLFLDPLAVDVPITREVQDINFGPANWLLLAVSQPGFSPWNFIFPVLIILGVALLRRFV